MAYSLVGIGDKDTLKLKTYICDTKTDLNLISIETTPIYSQAYVIEDSIIYMLTSTGQWAVYKKMGANVYRFAGSVDTYEDLPDNADVGDVYNVNEDGKSYAWTGTVWDDLGGTIDLSGYAEKTWVDNNFCHMEQYTVQLEALSEQVATKADASELDGLEEIIYDVDIGAVWRPELDGKLKKLSDVTMVKSSASGESIHLTDSADYPIQNMAVDGKTTQYTTTGAQLWDTSSLISTKRNGLTFTVQDDGGILVNGTATASVDAIFTTQLSVSPGNYYISDNSTDSKVRAYVRIYKSESASDSVPYRNSTFELLSTDVKATIYLYIANGTAVSNFVIYPMLNSGTTAKSFEKYTGGAAAPNPDYTQNMVSTGDKGNVVVTACGKNLLQNSKTTTTTNGVTFTVNSDGSITTSGTATAITQFVILNSTNFMLPSGSYTCSGCPSGGSNGNYRIFSVDTNNNYFVDSGSGGTITLSNGVSIHRFYIQIENGAKVDGLTFYPQIERGSTKTTYEPYKSQIVTIPLTEPLRSVGTYEDQIVKSSNGVYGVTQNTKKDIFDSVSVCESTGICQKYSIFDIKQIIGSRVEVMSDRFLYYTSGTPVGTTFGTGTSIRFYTNFTNITDANAWFAANPVTVIYPLATSTFTPLSDEVQSQLKALETYYGVTNIFSDENTNVSVEYVASNDLKFINLQNQIDGLGATYETQLASI